MAVAETIVPGPLEEFLREFAQFESALDGYPIGPLLQLVSSDVTCQGTAYRVVDQCLSSWISTLDSALASMPTTAMSAVLYIDGRERSARDALVRLKSKLPPTSVRPGDC